MKERGDYHGDEDEQTYTQWQQHESKQEQQTEDWFYSEEE